MPLILFAAIAAAIVIAAFAAAGAEPGGLSGPVGDSSRGAR